jgi:hypothetical protein
MATILFVTLMVGAIALPVVFTLVLMDRVKRSRRSISQDHPMGQSG